MDPSQVIIRPVVSEKSYVLATTDKYTFRVHPDAHKTQIKQAAALVGDWSNGGSVLVVLGAEQSDAAKSFRNLAGVSVVPTSSCGVADIVGHATLVLSQAALDSLTARARKAF